MLSGMRMQRPSATFTFSAMPPQPTEPITRSPTFSVSTPSPNADTTPPTSPPGAKGRSGLNWYISRMMRLSGKFTPHALMSSTTSPRPGTGSATSSSASVSGPPGALLSIAFIKSSP